MQGPLKWAEDRRWQRNTLWAWLGSRRRFTVNGKPWRWRVGNEHIHNDVSPTAQRNRHHDQSQRWQRRRAWGSGLQNRFWFKLNVCAISFPAFFTVVETIAISLKPPEKGE